jgi:hypothetical protein
MWKCENVVTTDYRTNDHRTTMCIQVNYMFYVVNKNYLNSHD